MRTWLLLLMLLTVGPACGQNLSGRWLFKTNVLGNLEDVTCSLQQTEKKLAGSCSGEHFPEAAVDGQVSDDGFVFSFTYRFADQAYSCTYRGTSRNVPAGFEFGGSIVITGLEGVSGEFKARKQ